MIVLSKAEKHKYLEMLFIICSFSVEIILIELRVFWCAIAISVTFSDFNENLSISNQYFDECLKLIKCCLLSFSDFKRETFFKLCCIQHCTY